MNQQEREAFESAIKTDRYDQITRLVYADWLEENGLDDEASEQRRRASPEWVEAARWMEGFVKIIGGNIVNYGLDFYERDVQGELTYERTEPEKYEEFTFDQVVEIAQHFVDTQCKEWGGEKFVQQGDESARDSLSNAKDREQFWKAWRTITGNEPGEASADQPFCCTC